MIRRAAAFGGVAATLVMAVSFLSVLVARSAATGVSAPAAQIGLPAPTFELRDTDDTPLSLTSLRGKVVVLMFTDPRCSVSNAYNNRINTLVQHYANEPRVVFLAISSRLDAGNERHLQELRVQRRALGQTFPTLIDADGSIAKAYGVTQTPTFHVVGTYGTLRYAGAFDDSVDQKSLKPGYLERAINQTLWGIPVEIRETRAFGCPLRPQ